MVLQAQPVNVLIVESDHRQTELAMELIKDIARAQIDSTNSGERAIELVSRMPYQLVIADSGIADMDVLSVLERVKRVSPMTSVILTSAFASIEEAVKAVRSGADEYFKKPYNPEQFKLAVRNCLERRALFSGDRTISGLMLLLNTCQLISGYLDQEKILDTVMAYLRRESGCKGAALFRLEGSSRVRVTTASDLDADVVEVLADGMNFSEICKDDRLPVHFVPKSGSTPELAMFQFRCPGDKSAELRYFAVCVAPEWSGPIEEAVSRFRLLQAQIQVTSRNVQNYRGVKGMLYVDEPTGLYNTRFLHEWLDRFFAARDKDKSNDKASSKGFSFLFLDIDKFKGINDSYGHLVGSRLLFEIGKIIKRCIRRGDLAFRYGGDEFVMLLEGAKPDVALRIAERIRSQVENHVFLSKEGLNVKLTVSIGVANCPEHAESKQEIIEAADGAMYTVKRSTRNSVYVAAKRDKPERKAA